MTGLNTYILRLPSGEYIYNIATEAYGYDRESAQCWLWTPEEIAHRVVAVSARMKRAGAVVAVRSRP